MIGPSRNEQRSARLVVAVQVLVDDSVALPPGEQLPLQRGKVRTVVNCADSAFHYGHHPISLQIIAVPSGSAKTKGPSSQLRTGEPAVPPQLSTVPGDPFPARSDACVTQLVFRVIGRTRALLPGIGRSGAGSGAISSSVRVTRLPSTRACCARTGSGLVPVIATGENNTDAAPREPTS